MKLCSFELPTEIKHGQGAIRFLADEAKELGMKRPLLITDNGVASTDILDLALQTLRKGKLEIVTFTNVVPNPHVALIDEISTFYHNENCDGLIGLGGGSPMDAAKSVGVVVTNGGSILDYEWKEQQPIKQAIPTTICIPTTAGTGSEVTLWSVVADLDRNIKFNVGGTNLIGPRLALIDPELTLNLPARITAATGMDALAHAVECYTCDYAQPFTDAVALMAIEYIGQHLRTVYEQGNNLEARYQMCMAAMLAGVAYGKQSAGAAHAMSQTAGGIINVSHGDLTGRLLGPVMAHNYVAAPKRFARIANALGENVQGLQMTQAAEKSIESVIRLTKDVNIPTLQDMGFTKDMIPRLSKIAYADPQTIGNPRSLTVESYQEIYESAFVA